MLELRSLDTPLTKCSIPVHLEDVDRRRAQTAGFFSSMCIVKPQQRAAKAAEVDRRKGAAAIEGTVAKLLKVPHPC
jgi:hypothetical protein